MRLVDDQRVVSAEETVAHRFREQDAIGHQLDVVALGDLAGKANLVTDDVSELRAQFLRDPVGDGARRDATRLRMPDQPADATTECQADLRQLRRLAGPRLATDDDDLVVANRRCDRVSQRADRQLFGKGRPREPLRARVRDRARAFDRRLDLLQISRCVRVRALGGTSGRAIDSAPERLAIAQHRAVERVQQSPSYGSGVSVAGSGFGHRLLRRARLAFGPKLPGRCPFIAIDVGGRGFERTSAYCNGALAHSPL